jgi:hypothetical protein
MVKKSVIIIACLLAAISGISQDKDWKINSALSFAPGLLRENTQTIQIHGYLGFLKDRIHFRGDAYYFLGSFGDRPRFSMNHQLYFGAFYHFSVKAFQPYVGFQPGIALAQSSEYGAWNESTQSLEYKKAINPVGSPALGFSYYGEKLFFLFAETRYIFGKHKSNSYPVFLDEWRFSFGLGFVF